MNIFFWIFFGGEEGEGAEGAEQGPKGPPALCRSEKEGSYFGTMAAILDFFLLS